MYFPKISNNLIKLFKNYGINLISFKNNNLKTIMGNINNKLWDGVNLVYIVYTYKCMYKL